MSEMTPFLVHQKALDILRRLRPHRVEGLEKLRLGRFFDGGYVMLDAFQGVSAAYSLGINDDVSWDLDIAARGVPVMQYDHTIDALPRDHDLFTWRRIGVDAAPNPDASLDTLANMVRQNGHEAAGNLILKCDVEGAEWRVLPTADLRAFSQIVIEVHDLYRLAEPAFAETARRCVANLTAAHRVVHVHANNNGQWALIGGLAFPNVLELTLARTDLGRFSVADETFPTQIDMPNHPALPDFYLGRFAFD
jgi:hypothetical protein